MSLKQLMCALSTVVLLTNCTGKTEPASTDVPIVGDAKIEELKIENLLRTKMGLADSIEIIVSYIEIPEQTELQPHWHPGEEYVYMIEGSGELILGDDAPVVVSEGEIVKIPLKEIHSYRTLDDHTRAVAFRVHEEGKPDRIMVE